MNQKKRYENKLISMSARSNVRQAGAISELKDINTIMMLGSEPVYIHSKKQTARAGMATARRFLDKELITIYNQVQKYIEQTLKLLEAEEKRVYEAFNFNSIQEFCKFWETTVEPFYDEFPSQDSDKIIRILAWLYGLKRNSKIEQWYKDLNVKGDSLASVKKRIKANFLNAELGVEFHGNRSKAKNDPIYEIYKDVDELWKELGWDDIKSELLRLNEEIGIKEEAIDVLIAGVQRQTITFTDKDGKEKTKKPKFDTSIGKIIEILESGIVKTVTTKVGKEFNFHSKNVATENKKNNDRWERTDYYKVDTQSIFDSGELNITLNMSDKTGLDPIRTKFNASELSKNVRRVFTASADVASLQFSKFIPLDDGTTINAPTGFDEVAQYVAYNGTDAWGKLEDTQAAKLDIVMAAVWQKAAVEIVGWQQNVNNIPLFIRNFGHIYPTSTLLKIFNKIPYNKILDTRLVPRSSYEQWMKKTTGYAGKNASKEEKTRRNNARLNKSKTDNLFEAKRSALQDMADNGQTITYQNLKDSISETLYSLENEDFNKARLNIGAHFRIILDNIDKILKEI